MVYEEIGTQPTIKLYGLEKNRNAGSKIHEFSIASYSHKKIFIKKKIYKRIYYESPANLNNNLF